MKKIIILISAFILINNLALAAGGDSGSSSTKVSMYDEAVKLIKRAGKLEKKNNTDKAVKLYKEAFSKLQKANKRKVPIKIRSRESVIFPSFVGLTFSVFNGRSFVNLIISETMVGHKFGEFIVTKKYPIHKKTK